MRNASEAQPVRPQERMRNDQICDVLTNATRETHIRIWFWPLSEIDEDDMFEEDGCLMRDDEEMVDCEVRAVERGTHLDIVVTSASDEDDGYNVLRGRDLASDEQLAFNPDEADCLHHVEVIKAGLPPSESFDYGYHAEEFSADPSQDHIHLDGNSVGQSETLELYRAMGRWLQHRGVTL